MTLSGDPAPFRFDGDTGPRRRGVLLVHGFSGTPFEMRPLGESLAARGLDVVGVCLPGHGLDHARLGATTWQDWYAAVEDAFDALRARTSATVVCGQSMGGLLTLELARRRAADLPAIATLAAALALPPWMARGIRRARDRFIFRWFDIPRFGGSDIADRAMKRLNPGLGGMPIAALNQLLDLQEHVAPRLGAIDRPALVAHARADHTIPFSCHARLVAALGGPVEELILDRSFHVLSLDLDRELLFGRIFDFFARHLGDSPP